MTAFNRRMGWGAAALVLFIAGSAAAQENLDSGKSAAELYASNCAICHKSPRGLARSGGIVSVQAFLREHYTASREAAAAIAAYLEAADRGPAPPAHPLKRAAKPKEKSKTGEAKPAAADKGSEPKAAEPAEAKPSEAPAEAGAKPEKPEKSDKPVEAKADDAKTPAEKPLAVAKPDTKPDAEKKSD